MILTLTLHPSLDKVLQVGTWDPNQSLRGRVVRIYAGGKGNNVARVLARFRVPVLATGFQGGYTGRWAKTLMKAEGIPALFVACRAETRWAVLVMANGAGRAYTIQEESYPDIQPEEEEDLRQKVFPRLSKAKAAVFCGPAGSPSLAATLAEGVRQARRQGAWTVLDSSGLGLRQGIAQRPDMVRVHQEEMARWLGRPLSSLEDVLQGIRSLHDRGIPWVAVSLNHEGLLLSDGRRVWHGALPMARILTTWGSEDALLAGMLYAWYQGKEPEDWVRWGVACGMANTQVLGAGFLDLPQVQSLVPKVAIKSFFL